MSNKIKCKGTSLKLEIASVYTAIPGLISITLPSQDQETVECDTLDNTDPGIPYCSTGRVEGGSFSAELYYDPADSTQQAISDLIAATPADQDWKVTFADSAASEATFTTAGANFGNVSVALNSMLTATVAGKIDGRITWPT